MRAILGKKAGMTQVFTKDGKTIAVTVVETNFNKVTQVKTKKKDGYDSLQLSYEEKNPKKQNKPDLGHAKSAKTVPHYFIKEIRDMKGFELGDVIKADSQFKNGDVVDVIGTSKGKGFQGSIKRHNYSRGPMSHGSKYHRGSGSMGDMRSVVKKSKKLPGHMGNIQVTMQNLKIVKIDIDNNVILIKGSIPGPNKSYVIIKDSVLKPNQNIGIEMIDNRELQSKSNPIIKEKKVVAKTDNLKDTLDTNIKDVKVISESKNKEVAVSQSVSKSEDDNSKIEKSEIKVAKADKESGGK